MSLVVIRKIRPKKITRFDAEADMKRFVIKENKFLMRDIQAFYHADYVGYGGQGNPDYITLKNTFNRCTESRLKGATQELSSVLHEDLPKILQILRLNSLTVCVVPRAKRNYQLNQLLFKSTVRLVINELSGFSDGTDFIIRHADTKTTHLQKAIEKGKIHDYDNNGDMPYPGITIATCNISIDVRSKDILLIDDLYTRTINIDEDAIQALLGNGANSVIFYAVGKTVSPKRF